MRWKIYRVGITVFCITVLLHGIWEIHVHPDLTQGLGVTNYIMCLVGTLAGSWIGLWAFGRMLRGS